MGAKAEISWASRDADGQKIDVCARRVGGEWRFTWQHRRFDQWQPMDAPPIVEWLLLLDSVRRRIQRRLLRPEEEVSVKKMILDRFPGTELD
ncbi:MAG: hypothetical protein EXS22_08765 [Pedosphaera sp.]|nr:hypothetical protein [Pedosphaera sp.]MSU44112.1 hypothetical protein [Pedosphaera sp.]